MHHEQKVNWFILFSIEQKKNGNIFINDLFRFVDCLNSQTYELSKQTMSRQTGMISTKTKT